MPECHNCPTARMIERGRFKHKRWQDTPCASCTPSEYLNNHGRVHVSFDEAFGNELSGILSAAAAGDGEHPIFSHATGQDQAGGVRADPCLAAISYLAKAVLALPRDTRDLVLERLAYPGRSLVSVSERFGIPLSTVHDRLKRARREWPALAFAIPMKKIVWAKDAANVKEPKQCPS